MDGASEGFIYISLGSNVQSKDLQDQTLKTIMDILRDLPFRTLWKYESDDLSNLPKNVKLVKWAPQQDILSKQNPTFNSPKIQKIFLFRTSQHKVIY